MPYKHIWFPVSILNMKPQIIEHILHFSEVSLIHLIGVFSFAFSFLKITNLCMCGQEAGGLHMQWSMCGGQSTTCGNLLSPSTLWISEIDFTSGLRASTFNSWAILQAPTYHLRLLLFSVIVLSFFVCLFVSFLHSIFSQNSVHWQSGRQTSWRKQPLFFLHGYREALLTSLSIDNLGYLSRYSALCSFPWCNLGKCSA